MIDGCSDEQIAARHIHTTITTLKRQVKKTYSGDSESIALCSRALIFIINYAGPSGRRLERSGQTRRLCMSKIRRNAATNAFLRAREAGRPIENHHDFLHRIQQWVEGEIEMSEVAYRYRSPLEKRPRRAFAGGLRQKIRNAGF